MLEYEDKKKTEMNQFLRRTPLRQVLLLSWGCTDLRRKLALDRRAVRRYTKVGMHSCRCGSHNHRTRVCYHKEWTQNKIKQHRIKRKILTYFRCFDVLKGGDLHKHGNTVLECISSCKTINWYIKFYSFKSTYDFKKMEKYTLKSDHKMK